MGLLASMNLFDGRPLPYSTAVLVELHKDNHTHYVNIWLRNASRDGLHQLTLPGQLQEISVNLGISLCGVIFVEGSSLSRERN